MALIDDIQDLSLRVAQEFNQVRTEIDAQTHTIADVTGLQAAIDGKEPALAAGTSAQYFRGDKALATLNKAAVGLGSVDNTSDAAKNIAAATLENKTISGSVNTFSNIPQSAVSGLVGDLAAKQATNANLTQLAAITFAENDVIQVVGGVLAKRTIAQLKTSLGIQTGGDGAGYLDNQGNYTVPAGGGGGGGGETNLVSNIGSSIGIFKEKSGVTFRLKSLHPASNKITMADDTPNDRITFDVNQANLTLSIAQITGLQAAIDGKEAVIPSSTSARYFRGDKAWADLNKAAVGLGSVDNTADTAKPVSTLQQAAIDLRLLKSANLSDLGSAATARTNLGLGNVDNTADTAKPVSSAQQAAIDLRVLKSANLSDLASVSSARSNLGLGGLAVKTTIAAADIDNDAVTPDKIKNFVALTDAATVALDSDLGKVFGLSSANSRTIDAPTNAADGRAIIIRFTNTAGTSQTLSLNAIFKFTDAVTALTATPAGKTDWITAIYVASETKWHVVGYAKGT